MRMGKAIQDARKKGGWKSADAYAEHLGLQKWTYISYEQNRAYMPLEVAWKMADDLGISLDELFGRDFK